MKKLLIIIVLLTLVGSSIAQDVYAVGYYSVGNGTNAALYKNGNRLYIAHHPSYYSRASKVTFNSDGDVYWMVNYYNTNGSLHHSEIQKNNEVLSVPDGFQVVDFYCLNDTLYTVCQTSTSNSVKVGAVLKGDDFMPYWQIGDGIQPAYIYDADVDKRTGIPYFCGYIVTEETNLAAVWKENELYSVCQQQYILDSITSSSAHEISVDNGHVFTQGYLSAEVPGAWIDLRVIWKDNEYFVEVGNTEFLESICAFAGDLYYIYSYPHGWTQVVYKNTSHQELLSNFNGDYANNIYATLSNLYVCGKKHTGENNEYKGCVWKNFEVLQQFANCDCILDIAVDERSIDINNEWYYEIQNADGTITYQHLECQTDTVIENKRPKVIVRSNTQYDRDEITEVTHEYVYEEYGVVYWWNKDLQEFTTLYNFAATQGEEWEIKVGTESIVMHVDTVGFYENEGNTYRMLRVSDENGIFSGDIVSGIGHLTSFFPERLMNRNVNFTVDGMRCYWVTGELRYHNGDECDAIYTKMHGVEEMNGNGFAVYPNPANGVLFVETFHGTSPQGNAEYRITNLMGQTLLQGSIDSENQQIDIANLPTGMFFLTIEGETLKFVKQ